MIKVSLSRSLCVMVNIPSFPAGIYGFACSPDFKWHWTLRLLLPPPYIHLTLTRTCTCLFSLWVTTPREGQVEENMHYNLLSLYLLIRVCICTCESGSVWCVSICQMFGYVKSVFIPARVLEQVGACLHAPPSCCVSVSLLKGVTACCAFCKRVKRRLWVWTCMWGLTREKVLPWGPFFI